MGRSVIGIHCKSFAIVPIGIVTDVGLKCNCICHDCKEPLEAVLNGPTRPYFRHSNRSNCNPTPESVLHLMAKRVFLENDRLLIPGLGSVNYTEPKCEVFYDRLKPDVILLIQGAPFFVEIVVTNAISVQKRDVYQATGARVLVIDLRDFDRETDFGELENLVLNEPLIRSMLTYQNAVKSDKGASGNGFMLFGALIGIALITGGYILDLLRPSLNKWRRRY
jgi:hypothetical protein